MFTVLTFFNGLLFAILFHILYTKGEDLLNNSVRIASKKTSERFITKQICLEQGCPTFFIRPPLIKLKKVWPLPKPNKKTFLLNASKNFFFGLLH